MRIFAIADLHLSFARPKEMDVFGSHWKNHFERISQDWQDRVKEEDMVLIPGDISWAMKLEDALPDLEAIAALPGRKVLIRGNHDYWWRSIAKMNDVLPEGVDILQNNCLEAGEYVFCGTRGWIFPTDASFSESDRKIYEREKIRLTLSLDNAKQKVDKKLIVLMHYPPLYENNVNTEFVQILETYGSKEVVFGHLHGEILKQICLTDFLLRGVNYNLVSADYLDFKLKQIL
jgi:predicted phosphohydrolase